MNKFGTQSVNEPVTHIESVSVKGMLSEYGSPLFVISEKQIRRNYQNAVRIFKTRYPKVQFAWSYKTNYMNAVCRIFHQEGSWAEVVSGFEYEKALGNGMQGNKIIFQWSRQNGSRFNPCCNSALLLFNYSWIPDG